ncbi:MAG: MFS transporter [bacterium]|nr:MFS transporter [bacterium]
MAFLISLIGSGISKLALLWLSYDITGSAATTGMVFACLTLPGIFAGLISGALADRISKLKILVTARILMGFIALGFAATASFRSIIPIYILSFLMGGAFAFVGGPFRAYLAEIFPKEKLPKVNSAVASFRSLSMLIGPALGGIILAVGNVQTAFIIDAATFFISAVLIGFLPSTLPRMVDGSIKAGAIFMDMKRGLTYLWNSPPHRFMVFFFVILFGIYYFPGGLVMPFCKEVLAIFNVLEDSTALAVIEGAFGLGGFVSAFFIPAIMKKIGSLRTMILGAALCTVELLAFGYIANIYVLSAIIVITAASGSMLMVPVFTFMQGKTEPRYLGRVMGSMDTLILFVISFSFGFGGMAAETVGIETVFIITGFIILALTFITVFLPGYKRMRMKD